MRYAEVVDELRAAGCVFAEDEAILLVDAGGDLRALLDRRVSGEPVEHLVGWASLSGLRIEVDAGVFVPRRRTELLARRAAALARPDAVVVDLCCGSGAVGAVVRAVVPGIELHAVDIDPLATACAVRNLGEHVYTGDLFDALPQDLRGRVDVLVANAPYVPTDRLALMPAEARDHEPRGAQDGGADGLDVIRRIVASAREWLVAGGAMLFEIAESQWPPAERACVEVDLVVQPARDSDLGATIVIATAPSWSRTVGASP